VSHVLHSPWSLLKGTLSAVPLFYPQLDIFMRRLLTNLLFATILTSCIPVHTTDADEAFENWAGYKAPSDFEIIEGEYFKSPHFTYEFEVFLKIKPTEEWWIKLIEQYKLTEDYQQWTAPERKPNWFMPSNKMTMYSRHDIVDQSRFFYDRVTGQVYIYEVQF
jgi:hypothetical protein